jgi:hypothetical protein
MIGPTDLLHPSPAPHFKTFQLFLIYCPKCPSMMQYINFSMPMQVGMCACIHTHTGQLPNVKVVGTLRKFSGSLARQKQSVLIRYVRCACRWMSREPSRQLAHKLSIRVHTDLTTLMRNVSHHHNIAVLYLTLTPLLVSLSHLPPLTTNNTALS